MGYVQVVGKQQLQRVLPRGQVELGAGSGVAVMHVLGIRRYRQAQVWQVVIDDDVVVAAVRAVVARGRKTYPVNPEFQLDRTRYGVAIRRRYEKYSRITGRWRSAHSGWCHGLCLEFFRCRPRLSALLIARQEQQ